MSVGGLGRREAILEVCSRLVSDLKTVEASRLIRLHVMQHHLGLPTQINISLGLDVRESKMVILTLQYKLNCPSFETNASRAECGFCTRNLLITLEFRRQIPLNLDGNSFFRYCEHSNLSIIHRVIFRVVLL